jgi:glutamate-1-semialdehyde aminotransferase
LTRQHGVVLIFDEVVTGFRFRRAGRRPNTASGPI